MFSNPGKMMRVLIHADPKDLRDELRILGRFLLNLGVVVRTCRDSLEFKDLAKKPNVYFGLVILLTDKPNGVTSDWPKSRCTYLEFSKGKCSITDIQKFILENKHLLGKY